MNLRRYSLASLTILLSIYATFAAGDLPVETRTRRGGQQATLSVLQDRLGKIDDELEQLASLSLRSGIGAIGYRSRRYGDSNHTDWIRIDLGETTPLEQIVLVPTIWRDAEAGFRADGFPLEFHLVVGSEDNPNGSTIAHYGAEDLLLPRLAPLVVNCPPGTEGSWVQVVATSMGARLWDGRHDLQLSEIMIFSGEENVALHANVEVSSSDRNTVSIDKRFLTDGHLPYLMDAKEGRKSIAFVTQIESDMEPEFILDLGEARPVNRVHLHAVDTSDTAPQSHGTDYAMPRRMRMLGSNQPDLSDATELCRIRIKSIYDSGPIMMRRFDEGSYRYVALIASQPFVETGPSNTSQIGFAEIELFSEGENIAFGRPVTVNFDRSHRGRQLSALTDGRNFYGEVLPVRDWMNQLARRHELETERPGVLASLEQHYALQAKHLRLARWIAATLAVAVGFVLLGSQLLRTRQLASVKERFAADLHDELGANLHAIGLLSDLADDSKQEPDELADYLQRIRALTERTGVAMRHLVQVRHNDGLYTTFFSDMEQAAKRIAVDLDHEIQVEGEQYVNRLKPRTRVDLLLFYKECLVNISRHSGATQLQSLLVGTPTSVELTVTDNGRGLAESDIQSVPPSLERRAKLLGAKVNVENASTHGTCIHLVLRTRRWGVRR